MFHASTLPEANAFQIPEGLRLYCFNLR